MKEDLLKYIDAHHDEILQLGDTLFHHPELGFHEFQTREILISYLTSKGLKVDKEFACTGFSVTIGSGKPHVGIIAELDAIPTRGHPDADPETTAAHACGHSTQQVIALEALLALNEQISQLKGTVTLFFTPAEEFTDLAYRRELQKQGKIRYLSGKQNMLAEKLFDDVDCLIHMHAMGSSYYRYSVNSTLAGFVYKKLTFVGRASHAAVLPHLGINALSECNLFLNAIGLLRETFRDEDMVRVHGFISDGGNTVNSIPDKVVYEMYARTKNAEYLRELNAKITNAAEKCAEALGGRCMVEDIPGYFPLTQDPNLCAVVEKNILQFTDAEHLKLNEDSIAGGDVGDISLFKPIIQYGYNGFSGRIHGADMRIEDPDEVYINNAKITAMTVYDLLTEPDLVERIVSEFQPKITYEEYLEYLKGQLLEEQL